MSYIEAVNHIIVNGKFLPAGEPALLVSNRGYRYGDGLFETLRIVNGKIRLGAYHADRLWEGLDLLRFEIPRLFTPGKMEEEILRLVKKNNCENSARVRFSVFRGNGGLYDDDRALQYLIESWPLQEEGKKLQENGLIIDIYPDARKGCDAFARLKSANFLPYSMAAIHAKANKWNDCIVLNTKGNLADSTIANIFLVKEDEILTPGLTEGPVAGVMRRYLLESLTAAGYRVRETPVSVEDLSSAQEVFLTNAIQGIRWVKQFRDSVYTNTKTAEIFRRFMPTIPC